MKEFSILFFQRQFPSANMVLIKDQLPVLIDTGYGSDATETEQLIRAAGVAPEELYQILNTHYHSDHVGGNHYLQQHYGVKIGAHKWEAHLVNSCDLEACTCEWLDQPVEPYRVDVPLSDQDEIQTGTRTLQVLHIPAHTLGHLCFYEPEEGILICGDFFHGDDIGWLNIFREGVAAILRALEGLDRVSLLPIQKAYSGHGPMMEKPRTAIDTAKRRYEKWLKEPEKIAWHGCKRIFAYALMIKNGLPREEVTNYLISCGWFRDFARYFFQLQPEEFIRPLLEEMLRSGAARWQDNRLVAGAPFRAPSQEWIKRNIKPKDWKVPPT
ncbi:MAG: MBL fold metallo-hydrolase [Clostridia bacterium]|nr:MBL fold metallo-hydrolase [Clostridia bacterium]